MPLILWIIGGVVLAIALIYLLWFLIILKFALGVIKEVKGPGTPRFPRR